MLYKHKQDEPVTTMTDENSNTITGHEVVGFLNNNVPSNYVTIPNSGDLWEEGDLTFYVETLTPYKASATEQIFGHYNWRFIKDSTGIKWTCGRMNSGAGPVYTSTFPLTSDAWDKVYKLTGFYHPDRENGNGYIRFVVWSNGGVVFDETVDIGYDVLYKQYGNYDATLFYSRHGTCDGFTGVATRPAIFKRLIGDECMDTLFSGSAFVQTNGGDVSCDGGETWSQVEENDKTTITGTKTSEGAKLRTWSTKAATVLTTAKNENDEIIGPAISVKFE